MSVGIAWPREINCESGHAINVDVRVEAGINWDVDNNSFPIAKGTSLSKYSCVGISAWTDACKVSGSHSLHFNNLFAKSQIDSDIIPHLNGQGAPPKVSQRVMIARLSSGSCAAVWRAITKWNIP